MNEKTARKMRKQLIQTVDPNKYKEAEKALKELHRKGLIRFGK